MNARSTLARLRAGDRLSEEEVTFFASGLASGAISDAQAGAFAMAVCLHGLGHAGRVALTTAMRDSGDRLRWDLPGPVVDKHSTGGIGDPVSLLMAPALAACGCYVPMISGRGLGHTGGTLDKLQAIPGVAVDLETADLKAIVRSVGCAIVGATGDIAPADRRLYAIRDLTSTVDSVDLITASILSKKLAAGPQALVLDVKVGSGAFMQSAEQARELAEALVETAGGAGCPTDALITEMGWPLADALGNALEITAVLEALTGVRPAPALCEITAALGGTLLARVNKAANPEAGAEAIMEVLTDGRAAEVFGRMIAAQGGPSDFIERWRDRLPAAPVMIDVLSRREGYLAGMDGRKMGEIVVELGGGRRRADDRINPAVGLSHVLRAPQPVEARSVLARVHAASRDAAEQAAEAVRRAMRFSETPVEAPPLVHERIG